MQADTSDRAVAAYYRVRQMLGGLGVALPFLMILTGLLAEGTLRPSMSDYYHALQRDIFVGCLFAIGTFLIAYRGHDRAPGETLSDEVITNLAGFGAICIALFPSETQPGDPVTLMQAYVGVGNAVLGHYIAAQVFLYSLAWMCFVHFGRTGNAARRRVYRLCGLAIVAAGLVATGAAAARHFGPPAAEAFVVDNAVVFWCEAVGVWAFGIAWLVKGRAEMLLMRRRPRP
ncbi:hypothetical protein [Pseudooceanicola sp. LIPI14-2-Ac024]|uniref:hypothetical protein n=1 Tax=Pseudooceanicola sp. LIPI14-2-Ac024 TaxID=3344875 RepID=UPI0035D03E1B